LLQDNKLPLLVILKQVEDDDLPFTFLTKGLGHDGGHSDGGRNKAELKHMACPMARA
jgi:hypothetical protein